MADIINKRFRNSLADDKLKSKLDAANCEALVVPTINPEIWKVMPPAAKKADLKLAMTQRAIMKASLAIAQSTQQVIRAHTQKRFTDKPAKDEMTKKAADSFAVLGHACTELSLRRRHALNSYLPKHLAGLCSSTVPMTSLLFGDDLHASLKQLKELEKFTHGAGQSGQDKRRPYNTHENYQNHASTKQTASPTPLNPQTPGMCGVRQRYCEAGFSKQAADLVLALWRPATQKAYNCYIAKWRTFALKNDIDPNSPSPVHVGNFLAHLFEEGAGCKREEPWTYNFTYTVTREDSCPWTWEISGNKNITVEPSEINFDILCPPHFVSASYVTINVSPVEDLVFNISLRTHTTEFSELNKTSYKVDHNIIVALNATGFLVFIIAVITVNMMCWKKGRRTDRTVPPVIMDNIFEPEAIELRPLSVRSDGNHLYEDVRGGGDGAVQSRNRQSPRIDSDGYCVPAPRSMVGQSEGSPDRQDQSASGGYIDMSHCRDSRDSEKRRSHSDSATPPAPNRPSTSATVPSNDRQDSAVSSGYMDMSGYVDMRREGNVHSTKSPHY
ncbi:hypothetical protein BaRGS_00039586 [Batillaria attramentaria]|uniref:Transmembrane protein n=1 Tax=Batillaria attramentaria TaxID=370345 RepID=A0ABD0J2S7_9CAEN